jgi:hypothetical protein
MILARTRATTVTHPVRPAALLLGLLACSLVTVIVSATTQAATITVINRDGANEGFNDPAPVAPVGGNPATTLGAQRLTAFQFAANLWGALLDSPVEIRVGAKFDPLTCNATSAILGSAGPAAFLRDFVGAPIANSWFPIALANTLHGSDLDPGRDDITATFNSAIGTTCAFPRTWYYGLDATPPSNQIDLVTVVLHELGHGLGFLTVVDDESGEKLRGFDDAYMRNLEDHATGKLYPDMTDAERLAASTSTGNLHWVGPQVRAASGVLTSGRVGDHVQMFAPDPQQPGSSASHFDTALTPDEVLEPVYTGPRHTPGLALPLFQDIGWSVRSAISLGPSLNRHVALAGDPIEVNVSVANAGAATIQDVYFVIFVPPALSTSLGCPNGDALIFVADAFASTAIKCLQSAPPSSFPPLVRSAPFPAALSTISVPKILSFAWPSGLAPGSYTFAIFTTPPNAFADGNVGPAHITAAGVDTLESK